MMKDRIKPGDVFVKRAVSSGRESVHVILPESEWTAKVPFMRLYGASDDSHYHRFRDEYPKGWTYVGTVPEPHLFNLYRTRTLR